MYIYIHTYVNKQTNKYLVLSDVNFKTRRTTRPQQLSAARWRNTMKRIKWKEQEKP
jgi:hypothetical protein